MQIVTRTITLLAVASLAISISCSTGKVTETATTDSTEVATENTDATAAVETETPSKNSDEISLKGIYVTSIRIPHDQHDYHNLFDGDEKTYWATMPNAGPDEGVMLYFNKGISISKLQIKQPDNELFSKIKSVTIYVNGQSVLDNASLEEMSLEATDVSSLFIRFSQVDNTEYAEGEYATFATFKENQSVAISELELYFGNKKLNIAPPKKVSGDIAASSTLEPSLSYGVRNLFDSRKEFVWVEGAPGNGEKQNIKISFASPQKISGLTIMNGFQRSEKHFAANARVKVLTIENENGEKEDLNVADKDGEQSIKLSKTLSGKQITLTVKEAYPGTTYKDLVVSELKFENSDGPFIVEDNITEPLKKKLLEQVKGTILDKVIDRRIYYSGSDEESNFLQSIILRSDYTFVVYVESTTSTAGGEEKAELIADGNWELKSVGADQAKIRIFGKLIRMSESTDYYSGDNSTSYLQIFQDNLTVTKESIAGEKFIEQIQRAQNE